MVKRLQAVPTVHTLAVVGGHRGSLEPKRSRARRLANDLQHRNPRLPLGSGR